MMIEVTQKEQIFQVLFETMIYRGIKLATKSVKKIIPNQHQLNKAMNRLVPETIELLSKKEKEKSENQSA